MVLWWHVRGWSPALWVWIPNTLQLGTSVELLDLLWLSFFKDEEQYSAHGAHGTDIIFREIFSIIHGLELYINFHVIDPKMFNGSPTVSCKGCQWQGWKSDPGKCSFHYVIWKEFKETSIHLFPNPLYLGNHKSVLCLWVCLCFVDTFIYVIF